MRIAFFTISLFVSTLSALALGPVPVVPATVEIAGIKLKLSADAREEIQKDVNALRASEKYFQIKLDRVNLYFPIVERVLREEGVPEDIKYLSIQESSLIADAVSTSNAVGYWQFKDFTAREVGLRVDSKIDERKNIVSATRGAAKYFKKNNYLFNNWIYCVSAYQAGPAGARKYVDENNFGSDQLTITSQTHWYVLRFIAHYLAFKDEIGFPHSEGLHLEEHNQGAGKSLEQIAEEYHIENESIADYNKWLIHGKIPEDKVYPVLVPIKGEYIVKENKNAGSNKSIASSKPSKHSNQVANFSKKSKTIFIKVNGIDAVMAGAGDNTKTLAEKSGISEDQLTKFNDLSSIHQIEAGEIYYIKNKKFRSPIRFHVAQYDETMWDISQKYGIKIKSLYLKNRMAETEEVKPGRLMWLYKKRPADVSIEYHKVKKPEPVKATPVVTREKPKVVKEQPTYVAPKDTSGGTIPDKANNTLKSDEKPAEIIAVKPDVKNEQVKATEPKSAVQPKSTAETPSDTPPANTNKATKINHVVEAGETLWSLSRQFGVTVDDIINWNELTTGSLHPGQELVIFSDVKVSKANTSTEEINPKTSEIIKTDPPKTEEKSKPLTDPAIKEQSSNSESSLPASARIEYHSVSAGESLWGISRKYNIAIEDLRKWNNLNPESSISVGQKLQVSDPKNSEKPKSTSAQSPAVKESPYQTYIVKSGDSLYKIARDYGMTVDEVMQLNNLKSNSLAVGAELKVKKQ